MIQVQILGPTYPDTATNLNNFAMLLQSRGDYAAHEYMMWAVAICEKVLGTEHPNPQLARRNLAKIEAKMLFAKRGQRAAAWLYKPVVYLAALSMVMDESLGGMDF